MITNVKLSTKENLLLQDQKTHEELCIQKYTTYANIASDPQLQSIFQSNAKQEQEHLDSINQILNGQLPTMPNHQSGGSQGQQSSMQSSSSSSSQSSSGKMGQSGSGQESSMGSFLESDKLLCTDMLDTEKYVSGSYNTAIFEFRDPQIRDVLNHIQKDEQKHGEAIFKYMESCGMYSTQ